MPILNSFSYEKRTHLKFLFHIPSPPCEHVAGMLIYSTLQFFFHDSQGENCLFIKSFSHGEEFLEANSKVQVLAHTHVWSRRSAWLQLKRWEPKSTVKRTLISHWLGTHLPKRWIYFSFISSFWRNLLLAEVRPQCCLKLPVTDVTVVWRKKK